MWKPVSIGDVRKAAQEIENIERPDADNEGDAINAPDVYNHLSEDDQRKVDHAHAIFSAYVRDEGDEPNRRAISTLNKNGYGTSFDPHPEEPYLNVGKVRVGEWEVDVSDEEPGSL
ncbi:hypothetical protein [Salinisphaera sp. T5B8]|uniref:hypothetical protein n=1 Tax=Salinisphaera sp. T5B8 TaxID=1304154 RepID=UPI00333EF8EF